MNGNNTPYIIVLIVATLTIAGGCIDNTAPTPDPTHAIAYVTVPTPTPETTNVMVPTPIPTPTLDPIDLLLNDIVANDVANKGYYSFSGGAQDVHVCGKMATEQCEYITENYGYESGIVLLSPRHGYEGHAQTWVIIGNSTFVIESVDDCYWTMADHRREFVPYYFISFLTLAKGKEIVKASDEVHRDGLDYGDDPIFGGDYDAGAD